MKSELDVAVSMDPTLVEARSVLLQMYAGTPEAMGGSILKAKEEAAAIMKLNPLRGHMGYAAIAEQEQDFPTAEKEFLAAIAARPDSEVAYGVTGAFYRRRERWADAIAMSEKQIKALAKDAPVARVSIAHYNLGLGLQKGGNAGKAKTEFQAALTANPDNAAAKKALSSMP